MAKIIKFTDNQGVIKEKIVSYFIDPVEPKKITVWLEGGFTINSNYTSEADAKADFMKLNNIMNED